MKITKGMNTTQRLFTVIRDRNTLLFQGEADAISSLNDKGPFDVLPQHANFISIIKEHIIIHLPNKQENHIALESGILKVRDNHVEIYLGILRK